MMQSFEKMQEVHIRFIAVAVALYLSWNRGFNKKGNRGFNKKGYYTFGAI